MSSSIFFSDKAIYVSFFTFFARCSANSLLPLFVPPVMNMILDKFLILLESMKSINSFYLEKYHHVANGMIVAAINKPITIYVAVELSVSLDLIVLKFGSTTGLSIEEG